MKKVVCPLLGCFLVVSFRASAGAKTEDPSIKIAAYDPNPEISETMMIARRMGIEPGIIEDPPQRAREGISRRNRRPLNSQRNKRRPSTALLLSALPIKNKSDNIKKEVIPADEEGPALILLSADELKNPHRQPENDSPMLSPVGPPVKTSTLRSAFVGGGFVQPPGILPPSPPSHGNMFGSSSVDAIRPPAPPISSPAPPQPMEVGPPTAPLPAMTPSPPPGSAESQVTNIKCLNFDDRQEFEALLSLPEGYEAVPVFEDRPTIDPTTNPSCRMIPTQLVRMFQLIVSNYETCGVRRCRQSNGETWHCLILRFPRINGLKLPEDEMVEIRCRPHDKTANDIHVLSVATAKYADKSGILTSKPPTVFEGLQEFECEIGLFRQLPGTQQFNSRVVSDAPLELGEKVQLWSIIKEGDGWKYSRLSEIVIQKEEASRKRSAQNTIVLVFSDGCRNPNYKVIAEDHPFRDPSNNLINKFTFRAFTFQDMNPGDSLLISAKVIGCVQEEDCLPATCPDDGGKGYGRKRRETNGDTKEFLFTTTSEIPPRSKDTASFLQDLSHGTTNKTNNWKRDLAIKIRMPEEGITQKTMFRDCKLYLFISLGISLVFCVIAIAFVSFFMLRNRGKDILLHSDSCPESVTVKRPPLEMNSSSAEFRHNFIPNDFSNNFDLEPLPIPLTVRKRKKKVNAELLTLFGNENLIPYTNQCLPMMNYYGYMVVPRPQKNHQKKVETGHKDVNKRNTENLLEKDKNLSPNSYSSQCVCKNLDPKQHLQNASDVHQNNSTVIRISSAGTNTVTLASSSRRPKPRPRLSKADNIYSEIVEDISPTIV